MFLHDNLEVNEKEHLALAGADLVEIAREFGTPAYVMDENKIRQTCRLMRRTMEKEYGKDRFMVLYASKALSMKEIYRIMSQENMGVDVVSTGEIYTAAKVNFPMERVYFHGNNKSNADIEMAMNHSVGCFVVDNREEFAKIDALAKARGKKQKVLLRVAPGIDSHTFEAVNTGRVDSKFGISLATGQAMEAIQYALTLKNIDFAGVHCHIGSQIFEAKPFCDAAEIMIKLIADIKKETGTEIRELNLGGGFGARYTEADPKINYADIIRAVAAVIKARCNDHNINIPKILIEPGRSIVAEAGLTLYTVGNVKEITGYKNYVAINGGMTDNPRYALYQSKYDAVVCNKNKVTKERDFECTIAGCCCESGDLIAENIKIQKPTPNDTLAVFTTGAYNFSMASNYNRVTRPPVIMIKNKQPRVVVKRQSLEDLVSNDL